MVLFFLVFFFLFFFLMIRRPPRSTLFPTRRSSDLSQFPAWQLAPVGHDAHGSRSEEHTSELQSRQYLVCRLLLEKKKKKKNKSTIKKKKKTKQEHKTTPKHQN